MLILTSAILSAFFVGFTYLGFWLGCRYTRNNSSLRLTDSNKEVLKQFMRLMNYQGASYEDKTH